MRSLLWLSPLVLVAALCLAAPSVQAQQKHALLIGAHVYERHIAGQEDIFQNLSSDQDVKAIRQALVDHCKFQPADITTITEKEDTKRAGILAAIQNLTDQTHAGDIVYIHYSGHGSEAPDPNGKEMDQTIVPTDYKADGSQDIRDKEIKALIDKLKAKNPANLTFTFDCCHSGTITRGAKIRLRGKTWSERFPAGQAPKIASISATRGAGDHAASHLRGEPGKEWGYVVISACRDDQTAAETEDDQHNGIGRLTSTLVEALKQSGPNTTYRDIFERIDSLMRRRYTDHDQNPQLEGDLDTKLFASQILEPAHYIPVDVEGTALKLHAGKLQGMTKGSRFALYLPGSHDFTDADKLAEAQITTIGALQATLEVQNYVKPGTTLKQLEAARAVEIEHTYGDYRIKIDPRDFQGLPQEQAILTQLRSLEVANLDLQTGQSPDVRLVHLTGPEATAGSLALVRVPGNAILMQFKPGAQLPDSLREALKNEARWRLVNDLNNEAPGLPLQIEMRVVWAKAKGDDENGWAFDSDKPAARGPLSFVDQEFLTVEVRNLGARDAYIALMDLESDGSVHQIWPDAQQPIKDNVIKAGDPTQWQKLWTFDGRNTPQLFRVTKPYGTEIFKAISTPTHADFSALETREPKSLSPLENLFKMASDGLRAGTVPAPTTWATSTFAFEVKPKK